MSDILKNLKNAKAKVEKLEIILNEVDKRFSNNITDLSLTTDNAHDNYAKNGETETCLIDEFETVSKIAQIHLNMKRDKEFLKLMKDFI